MASIDIYVNNRKAVINANYEMGYYVSHSQQIHLNVSKNTYTSINNMASVPAPEPTLVLYKSNMCRHCTALSNIWDTPPNKDEDSVLSALKKVYPKLRFYVLTAKDNTGKFDENTAPKDLIRYGKWYPMILLIPGRTWDTAMSKLGPKNDIQLVEGVQIMNGIWEGNELKYVQKYDIRKPTEFAKWLKESLENEEFKRIQNGTAVPATIVPTIQIPSQPIQPLLTNIVRPGNTNNNYVAAGPIDRNSSMETGSKSNTGDKGIILGDICSMRIISRPK